MTSNKTTFLNARVVLDDRIVEEEVIVDSGEIAKIGGTPQGEMVDCEGDFLIPGIIDLHTDNLEKHFFPRPEIDWNPVSASIVHDSLCTALGITTVFDAVTIGSFAAKESRREDNLRALLQGLQCASDQQLLNASHFLHLRCEVTSEAVSSWLAEFVDLPIVGMLSVMDHTPGQRQYPDLKRYLKRWADEGMSDREIEEHLHFLRDRQLTCCPQNRKQVASIAADRGLPLASHDDGEVAHVDEAVALQASIAEFPTTLVAAEHAMRSGLKVVMGAPNLIRGGSYSGNVSSAEVAMEGYLDVIASDYVPRGMIESAFLLSSEAFGWTLPDAIATVTSNAAGAAGLTDRGSICEGMRADLVRVAQVGGHPLVRGTWVSGRRVS